MVEFINERTLNIFEVLERNNYMDGKNSLYFTEFTVVSNVFNYNSVSPTIYSMNYRCD